MSNFDTALKILLYNEGGYNNNPNDKGGETYCGIARRYHNNWYGWKLIDAIKAKRTIKNEEIIKDADVVQAVYNFYIAQFNDKALHTINNTGVASLIFDTSQNHGNWGRVVYYGCFGLPKNNDWYNKNIPTSLTKKVIDYINNSPSSSYISITNARKQYVQYLLDTGTLHQSFGKGILNRVKRFASNFWQFSFTPVGGGLTLLLLGATFFF